MPVVPRKIFVGGLAFDTTEETFRTYFERFGKVLDAVVMRDPHTQRSRGFGFVTFQDEIAVEACLSCTRHIFDGRQVETKRATPPEETPWKSTTGIIRKGSTSRTRLGHIGNSNSNSNSN